MALDKWQKRQAEAHAEEHDMEYTDAVRELFPEEASASRRTRSVSTKKEGAGSNPPS